MEYKDIIVTRENGTGKIMLNRPRAMNALSMRLRDELEDSLSRLGSDDEVSLIMITGGPKSFSAGFDLKEAVDTNLKSFFHRIFEYHRAIYTVKKFVITAVSGVALAGGFDLALAGDMILASENASFGHVEVNFGVNPIVYPLAKKIGSARAQELCSTGRMITASEAKEMGLVNEVYPHDGFVEAAERRAGEIGRVGGRTLTAIKEATFRNLKKDASKVLKFEFSLTSRLLDRKEFQNRIEIFLRQSGMIK
ncbi:MAG: enoyl-CoA hydratase/isomerase family protein [Deltaproteobacteria bacterium]|uniref:Enoyl-CoA hydratase/isomerase family protein n=1 Tax=Candidatus Zymogenus saltonus TaxID=2844893 RepID=A0A9D8KGQ8_9DELT|nr:enoyl-CoA hydratase/isomerase family protein [Candidatus Zymogenus saltonus]